MSPILVATLMGAAELLLTVLMLLAAARHLASLIGATP